MSDSLPVALRTADTPIPEQGTMNVPDAVALMTALGHKFRVEIWCFLVPYGEAGLTAGNIATQFRVAPSSLSFHLQLMTRVGALKLRHNGRHTIYAVHPQTLNALRRFLTNLLAGTVTGIELSKFTKESEQSKSSIVIDPNKPILT